MVEVLVKQVVMLGQVANDVAHLDFKKAIEDYKNTQAEITKMFEDDARFQAEILDRTKKTNEETKKTNDIHREVISSSAKILGQTKGIADSYAATLALMNQQREEKEKLNGLSTKEKEVQDAVNKILDEQTKILDQINQKRIAAKQLLPSQRGGVLSELDQQEQAIKILTQLEVDATVQRVKRIQEEQNTFMFGWEKAYKQFAENSINYATIGETAFTSLTNNMTSALDQFVSTSKISFSSLASSIIADLIKIYLKMQATQLMSMMFGAAKGFFGGGGGVDAISTEQWASGAFANGGMPPVGVPSLVGENGPELFIPGQSGTIIPNNQLGALGGGGPQTVFNGPYIANMSAIDTQSAVQFLASNKMAVWSANQSASRSIPASR